MFQSSFLVIRARAARTVEVAPAVSIRELLGAAIPSSVCCYECQPPDWSVAEYKFKTSFRSSVLRDASHVKRLLLRHIDNLMGGAQDIARLASGTVDELWPVVEPAGEDAVASFVGYVYLANGLSASGSLDQRLGPLAKQVGWTVEKLTSVLTPVTGHCLCRSCGQERAQYSTLCLTPQQKGSRFTLRCSNCGHFENRFTYVRDVDWQRPYLRCPCPTCRKAQNQLQDYALLQHRSLARQMASAAQRAFAQVAATTRFDDLPHIQDARGPRFVDQFLCELRRLESVSRAVWQLGTRYLDSHGRPDPCGVVRALVADQVLQPSPLPASYDVSVVDIQEAWDSGVGAQKHVTFEKFHELLASEHACIALRAMRQDVPNLVLDDVNIVSRYSPSFTLNKNFDEKLG
jgi:hypothetical protein